jgi:hypothetical protein
VSPGYHDTVSDPDIHLARGELVAGAICVLALGQFLAFTWLTLDQPIIDLWGFRTAQTAIGVPYMLREGRWLDVVLPVFGEPWIIPLEFPFFQWCVALLVSLTGASVDASGRLVSAFFTIATLWPVFLLAKSAGLGRRSAMIAGALWLAAPLVIFFGRSFLIETTIVFLSVAWLAFYVRTLSNGGFVNGLACGVFGVLAAVVKITGFTVALVIGFVYTLSFIWCRRTGLAAVARPLLLAGGTVLLAAVALISWGNYADAFLTQNPLATEVRAENLTSWYLGRWIDRVNADLWNWTVRLRALPETLGSAWYVVLYGLARVGLRDRMFRISLTLLAGYLSVFFFFPRLHINHFYYQVENAIVLCGVGAIVTEVLLRRGRTIEGYLVLAVLLIGQLWTFYTGSYLKILTDDLHKHPYYQTSLVLKEATPPDSVIVAFGLGWGPDLPYFADRKGIILTNWLPVPAVRRVLFDERDRWLGGRKIGAVVDCAVYENQLIGPTLIPIRDELKREFSGETLVVKGSFYGATLNPSRCEISLPE